MALLSGLRGERGKGWQISHPIFVLDSLLAFTALLVSVSPLVMQALTKTLNCSSFWDLLCTEQYWDDKTFEADYVNAHTSKLVKRVFKRKLIDSPIVSGKKKRWFNYNSECRYSLWTCTESLREFSQFILHDKQKSAEQQDGTRCKRARKWQSPMERNRQREERELGH